MTSFAEEKYKGYIIHVLPDECPESPRDWDNLGVMMCKHYRYTLGDTQIESVPAIQEYMAQDNIISLPVFMYEHSGVELNTTGFGDWHHGAWDSGQVGYITVEKDMTLKEFSRKRMSPALEEKVKAILRSEVEIFSQYVNGEVYGYTVHEICNECGEERESEIDSCWGFYGDYEKSGLLDEAKSIIDYELKQKEEKGNVQQNTQE